MRFGKLRTRFAAMLAAAVWLSAAPQSVWSQQFETTLHEASAEVQLALSDGAGFMLSGGDDDAIQNPSVDFSAFAEATTDQFTSFFGRGAAYQDQFGINAVFLDTEQALADANTFHGHSQTKYDVSIKNVGANPGGTVPFTFVINGGEVRVRNYTLLDTFPFYELQPVAAVEATIVVDGDHWSFTTGITKDQFGGLVEVGTLLGNVDHFGLNNFPDLDIAIDGADAVITVPRIEGTVDLDLDDFDPQLGGISFSYTMRAQVDISRSFSVGAVAGITDPFALGTPDPGDDLGGPFGAMGVEFFLDGQPLSDYPVRVPEPSAVAIGLVALAASVGRRRYPLR